jgi:hypothetical protein
MLKKIISGCQNIADRATLDVAIKLGFRHGGWIPKRRITPTGMLPEKYKLKEMPTEIYSECVEQNVKESKATLIISYGKLTGDYDYARKITLDCGHQLLGIDLKKIIPFKAASIVNDWIHLEHIDVLYVIGPKSTVCPNAWKHAAHIVESALLLDLMDAPPEFHITDFSQEEYLNTPPMPPKTVDEAVDQIITEMPLRDRMEVANLTKENLRSLNLCLGVFIKNQLLQKDKNRELFESCKTVSGNDNLNEDNATFIIVEKLWEKLQDTHRLRVII